MSDKDTVLVLTSKSIDTMVDERGCGHWRANATSIMQCRYVVATRNQRSNWKEGDEEHGTAFLIGEISGVIPDGNRYVITMARFARIKVPNVWTPGGSNPVHYETLADLNIDPTKVKWESWPLPGSVGQASDAPRALTIAEAKAGLSATFGVTPEQIEITIKG